MHSITITILLVFFAAFASWILKPEKESPPPAPPVISVQEMGTLTTLRVNYANIIELSEQFTQDIPWTQWELRLGETKVLLVARGDCLLGTDLKLATYEQVNSVAKMATLALQSPKVISARLNHDSKAGGSYFHAVTNSGLATVQMGTKHPKVFDKALEKGQREVEATCAKPEFLALAKSSAETVLQPTVSATGWKIKIVWR